MMKKLANICVYILTICFVIASTSCSLAFQVALHPFGTNSLYKSRGSKLRRRSQKNVAKEFGKQTYWEGSYKEALDEGGARQSESANVSFSWYCGWEELSPFIYDLVREHFGLAEDMDVHGDLTVLLPGVGNDSMIVDMYDDGFTKLSAFDYAPAAIECCKTILGEERLVDVTLNVADARNLREIYQTKYFDVVIDKGTLDSIYLIGKTDKSSKRSNVVKSIKEFTRITNSGGLLVCVTAVATDVIGDVLEEEDSVWEKVVDTRNGVFMTCDGFASINIDATLLVYKKR